MKLYIFSLKTILLIIMIFFEREFQPMASAPNDSSLSSNQDTNQFLGVGSD